MKEAVKPRREMPIQDLATYSQPFLTVRMLARYWDVHVETVYRAVRKGALPTHRLPGGAIRIRREDAVSYGEIHEY